MHVLQKRINKDTFGDILEKVSTRLAGWKGQMLSFAGRITLTRSVLSSIPVHTMSTIVLPQSTLAQLDKTARAFMWGDTTNQRRQHLVAWDKICSPKDDGGLGIRKAQDMNKAVVAKLGWRLLQDQTSLWARVLRGKYKVHDVREATWFNTKGNWSSTWRSILKGMREVVIPGLSWVPGDGRNIRFWKDNWLLGKPLQQAANTEVPVDMVDARLCDMWSPGVGWRWNAIELHIPIQVKLMLTSVVFDEITGARDRISWGHTQNGEFSVRFAYAFISRDSSPRPNMQAVFKQIWHVLAPERVRIFLWLVGNEVIMTNMERQRRHLSNTGVCQVCRGGEESILHVLRDCPAMAGVWQRIVPAHKRSAFFTRHLLGWLYDNLGDGTETDGYIWSTLFAMGVWWGGNGAVGMFLNILGSAEIE
ncbi:unnamed protein product [Microthlaspi erraticum]|uniref:Reverse transcriptase zinc-binding domain-containing protein n=1 Tax=Microthlaspi erraticum TaxID=1685480 RepID=A0A6D2HLU2_9BRAS|nr:unnamed protein product [Microthlaspi erraticum]